MTKIPNFICIFISLIALCSWVNHTNKPLKQAEWLVGTWKNETKRGIVYETWRKVSKTELVGKSYKIKQGDTVVFETIRLLQAHDSLFYIPAVTQQNDGLPVRFAQKTISKNSMVFENLQHDFPQIIAYTKINKDSLVAQVSGTKNGKESKLVFPMSRLKH